MKTVSASTPSSEKVKKTSSYLYPMTIRQRILKNIYPLLMNLTRDSKGKMLSNNENSQPLQSFYKLSVKMNNGELFSFDSLKGKKVLLVNTACECGYTAQYKELQELYEKYNSRLLIIGFPANDFKEQEKATDAEIATFCQLNYDLRFPLAAKSFVIKGALQNDVFKWLTHAAANGWNNHAPDWNFSKYLVNEEGWLTHYFGPAVSPLANEIKAALEE